MSPVEFPSPFLLWTSGETTGCGDGMSKPGGGLSRKQSLPRCGKKQTIGKKNLCLMREKRLQPDQDLVLFWDSSMGRGKDPFIPLGPYTAARRGQPLENLLVDNWCNYSTHLKHRKATWGSRVSMGRKVQWLAWCRSASLGVTLAMGGWRTSLGRG